MKCPHCGVIFKGEATFCPSCKTWLVDYAVEKPTKEQLVTKTYECMTCHEIFEAENSQVSTDGRRLFTQCPCCNRARFVKEKNVKSIKKGK